MADPGLLYVVVVSTLLFVALGVGARVVWGIVGDAREMRRKRRSDAPEPDTEDPESDRPPRDAPESAGDDAPDDASPSSTCPQCGADNDAAFDYCRRCAAPLPHGG